MISNLKDIVAEANRVLKGIKVEIKDYKETVDSSKELEKIERARERFDKDLEVMVKDAVTEIRKVSEEIKQLSGDHEKIKKEYNVQNAHAVNSINQLSAKQTEADQATQKLDNSLRDFNREVDGSLSKLDKAKGDLDKAIERSEERIAKLRESFGKSTDELNQARRERALAKALRRDIEVMLPHKFASVLFYDTKEEMMMTDPVIGQLAVADDILYRFTHTWKVQSRGLFNATTLGGYTVKQIIEMARK